MIIKYKHCSSWQQVREAWAEDRPVEYFDAVTESWVLWTDRLSIDASKGLEWRVKPKPTLARMYWEKISGSHFSIGGVLQWKPEDEEPTLPDRCVWVGPWQEVPE